jgi:hypothetical protein
MGRISPVAEICGLGMVGWLTGDRASNISDNMASGRNSGDMGRNPRVGMGIFIFSIFGCIPTVVMPAVWRKLPEVSLGE